MEQHRFDAAPRLHATMQQLARSHALSSLRAPRDPGVTLRALAHSLVLATKRTRGAAWSTRLDTLSQWRS